MTVMPARLQCKCPDQLDSGILIMRMKPRYLMANTLIAMAWLTLFLTTSCSATSAHGAHNYFEGKALQLAIATERGDAQTIGRLIQQDGVDPDITFSREGGIPLLAWPLRARNLDGLRALLDNGADPNARLARHMNGKLINFNNAMVYAAKMDDPRYLEVLLDHGGDPNTRNSNRESLLLQAFLSGNQWQNIQLLVKRGAAINESRFISGGSTVLSWYTGRGGFNQAWWLIQQGADPTLTMAADEVTGAPKRMLMAEDIFWEITTPEHAQAQRNCQQWLLSRGIERMPMPDHLRRKREAFGYPTDEADIPLL